MVRSRRLYEATSHYPRYFQRPRWPGEARDSALNHGFARPGPNRSYQKTVTFLALSAYPMRSGGFQIVEILELIETASHIARIAIERDRAQAALTRAFDEIAKSEAELRTIIDAIPQLIVALGTDGNCLYATSGIAGVRAAGCGR
jgi:PAS domain-containing protein